MAELYTYYDEHVAREPELFDCSEAREHEGLLSIATRLSARLRSGFVPSNYALFEVRGTGLWHGVISAKVTNEAGQLESAMACFFYDERTGKGLVAVCDAADPNGEIELSRFSYVMARRDERLESDVPMALVAASRRASSSAILVMAQH